MSAVKRPTNIYSHYHAHVYFDRDSLAHARAICQQAGELFSVEVGRVHEKLVGPHPCWSCQLAFDASQFDQLIPWLEKNRGGKSILVHAPTGDDIRDHTAHASWFGSSLHLDLSSFGS